MPAQQYIKVLIAPAWDHNFPDGPSAWLDNVQTGSSPAASSAPHFHEKTGRKYTTGDKYYRLVSRPETSGQTSEDYGNVEKWWPLKTNMGVSSSVFTYDADPRVFDSSGDIQAATTATGNGGFGGTANETQYTKNRFRQTGLPISSFNANETVSLDIQLQSTGTSGTNRNAFPPYANHWQDAIHDAIIQGSFDTGATPETPATKLMYPNKPGTTSAATSDGNAGSLTYGAGQSSRGHQKGTVWSPTGSASNTHTYAYEYTLNVNSLTHSWDTVTSVLPLPHPGAMDINTVYDPAQINALAIDMGSMRETISVQGVIDDSGTDADPGNAQQPDTERWIRKQELQDIIRSQWGATLPSQEGDQPYVNPNRYVALTIGPMYTENPNGDQGKTFGVTPADTTQTATGSYRNLGADGSDPHDLHRIQLKALDMWRFGDEPHDDMRGTPHLINDVNVPATLVAWDFKPNYQGRRRYRGLIKNLDVTLQGGSPDIWEFSFEFQVFKNETTFRRTSNIEEGTPIKNTDS